MMRAIILVITVFLSSVIFTKAQTPSFGIPVQGQFLKDYFLVNYVDWSTSGIKDYNCGDKTYDGHAGTDFVLKSFRQMDSGVSVLAAEAGKVISVVDTCFDRNKDLLTNGSGNMIAIQHTGGYYTYYAHLKKNSALVKVGDNVVKGQNLAKIASSGYSSDPHLHFEVWYNSTTYVDPFMGSCGNSTSMWANQLAYDSIYRIIESGLLNFTPEIDTIRERPKQPSSFRFDDEAICFWVLESGVKNGDSATWQWYDPDGNLWYSYTYKYTMNSWYFYNWSYITFSHNEKPGTWHVKYLINGQQKKEVAFPIVISSINENRNNRTLTFKEGLINLPENLIDENTTVIVLNMAGQEVFFSKSLKMIDLNPIELKKGVYLLVLQSDLENISLKMIIY